MNNKRTVLCAIALIACGAHNLVIADATINNNSTHTVHVKAYKCEGQTKTPIQPHIEVAPGATVNVPTTNGCKPSEVTHAVADSVGSYTVHTPGGTLNISGGNSQDQ